MDKKSCRDIYKKKRAELVPAFLAESSRIIANKIMSHSVYEESNIIMAYASTALEIGTHELISAMLHQGKRVCLPVVAQKILNIVEINSLDELSPSTMGILEPPDDPARYLTPDLIIVPGIVFAENGYRIGYGGGYYDRLLSQTACPTIGICPDSCLVPSLPHEPHDVRVDYIFTELREIK